MSGFRTAWLLATLAILIAGCRGRSDLVEAELRYKDRHLREVTAERDSLAQLNSAFENTLRSNPPCPPNVGSGGHAQCHIKNIEVGRGTSGIDEDKCPGDEGIQVIIVPRDGEGSAVKAPGQARITALQITPEGLKVPLSAWDVSSAYLRRNWNTGLLSSGYHVSVPWQVVPCSEKLRILVMFQTPDGAVFEAERDIQVRLPQGAPPAAGPPAGIAIPGPPAPAAIPGSGMPPLPGGDPAAPPPPSSWPSPLPPPTPLGPTLDGTTAMKPNTYWVPAQLSKPQPRPSVILEKPID